MNRIPAVVTAIHSIENLTVAAFEAAGVSLHMMALGLDAEIKIGSSVILGVKGSNISLAKDLQGILSTSNQLQTKVKALKEGELLCSVTLQFKDIELESVITRASARRMDLTVGDDVTALIKSSELFISEVADV